MSITLTSVLDVLVAAGGGGGGATTPVIGTSPAKIEGDSAHINTAAIASFFMVVSSYGPFDVKKYAMILT